MRLLQQRIAAAQGIPQPSSASPAARHLLPPASGLPHRHPNSLSEIRLPAPRKESRNRGNIQPAKNGTCLLRLTPRRRKNRARTGARKNRRPDRGNKSGRCVPDAKPVPPCLSTSREKGRSSWISPGPCSRDVASGQHPRKLHSSIMYTPLHSPIFAHPTLFPWSFAGYTPSKPCGAFRANLLHLVTVMSLNR